LTHRLGFARGRATKPARSTPGEKQETAMLIRPRSGFLALCLACCFLTSSAPLTRAQNLTPAGTPEAGASINAQAFQALIASNKPICNSQGGVSLEWHSVAAIGFGLRIFRDGGSRL
jgi:hypothetical protein